MKWTREEHPVEKKVKIALGGVSVKFFSLQCRPTRVSHFSPFPSPQQSPAQPFSPQPSAASDTSSQPHTPTPPVHQQPSPTVPRGDSLSAESRALRRSNKVFCDGVDPENLVKVLYSEFLLTPEEKARAMNHSLTVGQKLEEVFQTMERRVSASAGDFHTMLQALKAEPALKAVASRIQGIDYDSCIM